MDHIPDRERNILRRISGEYADRLRPETRRRILTETLSEASAAGSRWGIRRMAGLAPQAAAASVILLILSMPALISRGEPEVRTPVQDLEVRVQGASVVLTWTDGGQPRRIVRATSREELAHLDEARGVTASGERWVDARSASEEEPIVYYYVE